MSVGFVYVLMTNNGRYYVSSTNDIHRRIQQHKEGKSLATKNVRPITLLYYREYDCLSRARSIERQIKNKKSTSAIQAFMDSQAFG